MKVISEGNKRVNITVLLDDKTLTSLRAYGFDTFGKTNVSQAIMSMIKKKKKKKKKK